MVLMVCSYGFITISNIRFSIPDDYLINNIISGTYGSNYDYQLLYINNILGIILKFFYNLIPGINIYTLYLIIILCISFSKVIKNIIRNKKYILLPIILIMYIVTLFNITYTIIAYLSVAIGLIEIIFNKYKGNWLEYFLIINGILLRKEVFIPVFVVMGTICIIKLLKNKDYNEIKNLFIVCMISMCLVISENVIYKTDEILNQFKLWHKVSKNIRDYKEINYNKYKKVFMQVNWNENDLKLFYSWNFADKEKFSIKNIKIVVNSIDLKDRYNFNFIEIIKNYFNQFYDNQINLNNCYIVVFLLLFLAIIIKAKEKKESIIIFIITISLNIILIVRNRYPFRVVYSQYLIAIIYYTYEICNIKTKINKKNSSSVIVFLMCILYIVTFVSQYNKTSYDYQQQEIKNKYIIEILRQKNALFIADSDTYNKLTMNYKISERKKISEYDFLIKSGGGDCFSKRYYNYIKRYNLEYSDNLYKNLKDNNVYYIGIVNDILTKYLKENIDTIKSLKAFEKIEDFIIYKYQK